MGRVLLVSSSGPQLLLVPRKGELAFFLLPAHGCFIFSVFCFEFRFHLLFYSGSLRNVSLVKKWFSLEIKIASCC